MANRFLEVRDLHLGDSLLSFLRFLGQPPLEIQPKIERFVLLVIVFATLAFQICAVEKYEHYDTHDDRDAGLDQRSSERNLFRNTYTTPRMIGRLSEVLSVGFWQVSESWPDEHVIELRAWRTASGARSSTDRLGIGIDWSKCSSNGAARRKADFTTLMCWWK